MSLRWSPILGFVDVVVFWVCESLWVSVGFSASASGFFFFFPQWWWLGWIWVCWVEMEECEFVG